MRKPLPFVSKALLCLCPALFLPSLAEAVTVSAAKLPQNAFGIEIQEPYQSFYCKDARKITHVSLQKYVSSQATESTRVSTPPQYITEMTIDFESMPGQVRIYAMEEFDPLRIAQKIPQYGNAKTRLKNTLNKATKSNVTNLAEYLVVKTYPHTTHAKTIEFRLPDAAEVEEFYKLFNIYYLRERKDFRYLGKFASEISKTLNDKVFIGLSTETPSKDWADAVKAGELVRLNEQITVSGLGGLLFTLGTPDTIATEIERQDVNKNKK